MLFNNYVGNKSFASFKFLSSNSGGKGGSLNRSSFGWDFSHLGIQLWTTKVNKLSISGTRFFDRNLMTGLKSDRQKELKNGVFMLFPQVFGCAKILSEFLCILHHHLSQPLRKILLIKLISITLCMSISSPESSASLASFFWCNWCDSRDLVISSSSSPSLTV